MQNHPLAATGIKHSCSEHLLLIAAKYPEPGSVKRRLATAIGNEAAAQFYRSMLRDLARRFAPRHARSAFSVCWMFTPNTEDFRPMIEAFTGVSASPDTYFVGFPVPGLVEQQIIQFQWSSAAGFSSTVFIVSDTPHLRRSTVDRAFDLLDKYDVVLGPAEDGGYYLLGLRGNWKILNKVAMSTDHVADDIRKNAEEMGLSLYELEYMFDVDTKDDLETFLQWLNRDPDGICPNAKAVLASLALIPDCRGSPSARGSADTAALALQSLGFLSADALCICLPDIPERQIAIEACLKLGVRIVPIDVLRTNAVGVLERLRETGARAIITTDGCRIKGQSVPTKAIVDRASIEAPEHAHTIVVKNLGLAVSWLDGRDLSWEAFLDFAPPP